jgi:cytidine deaminase
MSITPEHIQMARNVRKNAYAPYSEFYVGCCLITEDGHVVTGCNVENAVYGLAYCAERTAINTMVAQHGKQTIADIIIVSSADKPCPPCGACRQVICEFSHPTTRVHMIAANDECRTMTLHELLPEAFNLFEMETENA